MPARKRETSGSTPAEEEKGAKPPKRTAPRPAVSTLVKAQEYIDAGDRCAVAGDRAGALSYYGVALNDYLREGLLGLASSVARRMLQRYPDVVRARMTLAAITLAEGLRMFSAGGLKSTIPGFQEYVKAARGAGQEEVAIRMLRRFAEVTESPDVRERIAHFLEELGDREGAEAVLRALPEVHEHVPDAKEQRDRWLEILLEPMRSESEPRR